MTRTIFALALALAVSAFAAEKPIDTRASKLEIHVGRAGAFSFAGHEHTVSAPIASGAVDDGTNPRVEFTVEARSLKLVNENPKDEAEVQSNMETKVLEVERFPKISFRSTKISPSGDHQWKVTGDLTLHGTTKPVDVTVRNEAGAYTGQAHLRQTEFGITPISAGGGTVKVKNELDITFRIITK